MQLSQKQLNEINSNPRCAPIGNQIEFIARINRDNNRIENGDYGLLPVELWNNIYDIKYAMEALEDISTPILKQKKECMSDINKEVMLFDMQFGRFSNLTTQSAQKYIRNTFAPMVHRVLDNPNDTNNVGYHYDLWIKTCDKIIGHKSPSKQTKNIYNQITNLIARYLRGRDVVNLFGDYDITDMDTRDDELEEYKPLMLEYHKVISNNDYSSIMTSEMDKFDNILDKVYIPRLLRSEFNNGDSFAPLPNTIDININNRLMQEIIAYKPVAAEKSESLVQFTKRVFRPNAVARCGIELLTPNRWYGVQELKKWCSMNGIKRYSKLSKNELIKKLMSI